ncbi:endothelial differentiation-related factor 1 homolog isoform X3 [Dunckerocampus dactyliophorus]|uniref:endothelial differentiation-related factor 1 homolog isoform X3 n=1 Tax=Dunckerocampus dactyliophorus TaxID=161453 RepID=UPI002406E647|nr:endothelial differentiation-related factor 1 homolog isoform X3 [Dunckerocampus dactyliophorus]
MTPQMVCCCSMAKTVAIRPDEGLMMMLELDDRLKEQIDRLEHVRLAAIELKDNLSMGDNDLSQSLSDHLEWLNHLSERVENLQMNTAVFVQMNPKPRAWSGKQGSKHGYRWGRVHVADDVHSEFGWSPIRTRRNSDAASEMSCNW